MIRWYLLNYIAPALRRKELLEARIRRFNELHGTTLRLFAPEIVEARPRPDGSIKISSHAVLFHYIFVQGSIADVKLLCADGNGLSFVLRNQRSLPPAEWDKSNNSNRIDKPIGEIESKTEDKGNLRYVSLTDAEIEAFRIIARAYCNRLPYYNPADIDLLDGDEVEVVSGPFAGLRGLFISRRGTQNGNIVVQATGQIGSIAYNIKADTIRILRFAKDSRRAYDQIDAFVPRLLDALEAFRADRSLSPAQSAPLHVFTRRFGSTEIPGVKLDAKLQALLATAHRILGNQPEALAARARYEKRLPNVTNPRTITLLKEIMKTE